MAEVASRLLDSLPARPPTPPRDNQSLSYVSLKPLLLPAAQGHSLDFHSSLQTPPSAQSLLSSASKNGSSDSARRKRVLFSTQDQYSEPPVYPNATDGSFGSRGHSTPPLTVLPPSSSASRPTKSILKATAHESVPLNIPVNIADVLSSAVQQLASADRDSKLDAYLMLSRALKASDSLPDRIALQNKMSLFTQFIQRDILASKSSNDSLDSTLVISALDLLCTFLHFSAIASTLPHDFSVFIIDYCIRSFEGATVPRDVLRTLMRVVYTQSFSAKVLTSDRVGRLVAALHKMDEQYDSKNIIVMRCLNYRTLIKNQPMLMAVHLDWVQDLLADMLSSVPHIRKAAIELGLDAAFALGRERSTSQRAMEVLQATVDDIRDERYLDYYADRLRSMTKNKPDSPFVPQIWSVVTLFLRNMEKWDFFMGWLRILQGCFNSSEFRTREEANYAWSRFAFALLRDNRPLSKKTTAVLTGAVISQLRRRGSGKQADDLRRVVLGCVCSFLYYTVRDTKQLDNIWDNIVNPVVLQLLELSIAEDSTREKRKATLVAATAILTGLVDCSTPRSWREDHIAKSPIVAPDDLPPIDAKWIRRNSQRVFALVGPILEHNFHELSIPRSPIQILWRSIVSAVSVAAAKEVKVSSETAVFVSHAFSLLLKLWEKGVPAQAPTQVDISISISHNSVSENAYDTGDKSAAQTASQFLAAAREFLLTLVDSLGCLPFTEKQLTKDNSNVFVPVATPSQRTGKGHAMPQTALRHLFSIVSSLPPGVQDGDDFADFVESVFAPFFAAKSLKGRRNLALELLQMSPVEAICPYGPWQTAAAQIAASMAVPQSSKSDGMAGGRSTNLSLQGSTMGTTYHYYQMALSPKNSGGTSIAAGAGLEFREVVHVLERGLSSAPKLPWPRWQALFCTLCDRVREETGEAGLAICVLDPLAKTILDLQARPLPMKLSPAASHAVVGLLPLASHPKDRQAVDAARRRLWGPTPAISSSVSPTDPFDHLYKLVNGTLQEQYAVCDLQDQASVDMCASLLREATGFLTRINDQFFTEAVSALQVGLTCWIRDDLTKLNQAAPVADAAANVWDSLYPRLETVGEQAGLPLVKLETLFCAAFSSKHRHTVNGALMLWNRMYGGHVGEVDYPSKLKETLTALQPFVDIVIPGLELPNVEPSGVQQPVFVDSQDASSTFVATTPRPSSGKLHTPALLTPLAATTPSSVNRAANSSGSKVANAKRVARSDNKKSTPPRPRHDDSQVEFTAIDSTSLFPTGGALPVRIGGNCDTTTGTDDESQVLTERQREVRDRQRETDALYAGLSSSPTTGMVARKMALRATSLQESIHSAPKEARSDQERPGSSPDPDAIALPEQPRATTPEPTTQLHRPAEESSAFVEEDFIASTPTPRRGQALIFPVAQDQENDPPSSPPEPRRYPLLPEILLRSRSSSILDEWQFSSSPPSGSPIAAHHTVPEPELSLADDVAARLEQQSDAGEHEGHEKEVVMKDVPPQDALPSMPASVVDNGLSESTAEDQTGRSVGLLTPRVTRSFASVSQDMAQSSPSNIPPSTPAEGSPGRVRRSRRARKASAKAVSQSSPICGPSRGPRLKLMAIPPTLSVQSQPPSMAAAVLLEKVRNLSQSSPVSKTTSGLGNSGVTDKADMLDCITVQSPQDKRPVGVGNAGLHSSPPKSQQTSRRSLRRKRKRSTPSTELDSEVSSPGVNIQRDRPQAQPRRGRSKEASQEPLAAPVVTADEADRATLCEDEEVHSQIAIELENSVCRNNTNLDISGSQAGSKDHEVLDRSASGNDEPNAVEGANVAPTIGTSRGGVEDGDADEVQPAKRAKFSGILAMLKNSLSLLQSTTLSRNEVHEIEDACMDVKRALYDAEHRGRQ